MKEKTKEARAITLVALVITIVVLIILAVVSINLVLGENGILEKAIQARKEYQNAQAEEDELLDSYNDKILIAASRGSIDVDELKALLIEIQNPTGSIITQMGNSAPEGYLVCDGGEYAISEYQRLADYIKEQFGSYDYFGEVTDTTKFRVPDLRGEFLRGTGGNGASVGEHQDEGLPNISGTVADVPTQSVTDAFTKTNTSYKVATGNGGAYFGTLTFNASKSNSIYGASNNVTPTNTSVLYCIKY